MKKPWITESRRRHPLDCAGSMVAHSSRRPGASDADSATMWPRATMSCATASRGASSGQGRPAVCMSCKLSGHGCCFVTIACHDMVSDMWHHCCGSMHVVAVNSLNHVCEFQHSH